MTPPPLSMRLSPPPLRRMLQRRHLGNFLMNFLMRLWSSLILGPWSLQAVLPLLRQHQVGRCPPEQRLYPRGRVQRRSSESPKWHLHGHLYGIRCGCCCGRTALHEAPFVLRRKLTRRPRQRLRLPRRRWLPQKRRGRRQPQRMWRPAALCQPPRRHEPRSLR